MGFKANSGFFKGTYGALKYKLDLQLFSNTKGQMPNFKNAVTPKEKFNNYSLDFNNPNAVGKAEAYQKGLGYTKNNSASLIKQIHDTVVSGKVKPYDVSVSQFGTKYKYRISVTGPNGKTKNVIAVYQIDSGGSIPRLITNYLEAK